MKMNARCLSLMGRLMAPALAGLALLAALPARAGDVYWSVGVQSPGVGATVSNAPPVVYAPAPVYVMPAPVHVRPRVVYQQPPVVYAPAPVYVMPAQPHHHKHKHWKHKHGGHSHHHRGEWQQQGWQHSGPVGYVRHDGGWRR